MIVPIHVKIIMCKHDMTSMKTILFGFTALLLLFSFGMTLPSFAHTTVEVGQYEIDAGWGIEPPIVGIRNSFVFKVTEPGQTEGTYKGITNAFKNLEVTAMYGGATKKIDINSDPRPGYYFSSVIPTKTGSYVMNLQGEIQGTVVNIEIPIEDVESTSILDFPPVSSEGPTDLTALKNAISSVQQDVAKLESGETTVSASEDGAAYDFAIFGLSIAGAAIIIAIIALVKRK